MKGTIRTFSLGLLTAGLMVIVTALLTGNPSNSTETAEAPVEPAEEEMSVDEMIEVIKQEGYHVVTDEEYITLSLDEESEDNEQQSEDNDKNDEDQDKEKETSKEKKDKSDDSKSKDKKKDKSKKKDRVEKYTLHITDGMPTSDIGSHLEKNKIVKDGNKFNDYLKDNGFDADVQLGKFKLTSDMKYPEIAKAITK